MKRAAIVLALAAMLAPAVASAHPHVWIQQKVRVIAKDGQYTHVEIEWRFDPMSSELEIPAIDEDKDGAVSPREAKLLEQDMMPEFGKVGYLTWLNVGTRDFRPPTPPSLAASIEDPATFVPADWDRNAGDAGMPMPDNKRVTQPDPPRKRGDRNLVYVMRFALPLPTRSVSIVTYDPEDDMRIEVDKASLPAGCTLAKHPTYKSEFVRGMPVFADLVSCKLP